MSDSTDSCDCSISFNGPIAHLHIPIVLLWTDGKMSKITGQTAKHAMIIRIYNEVQTRQPTYRLISSLRTFACSESRIAFASVSRRTCHNMNAHLLVCSYVAWTACHLPQSDVQFVSELPAVAASSCHLVYQRRTNPDLNLTTVFQGWNLDCPWHHFPEGTD